MGKCVPYAGRAYSHRIPPVRLKCVSEKRVKELAGLLGGEQARRQSCRPLRPSPLHGFFFLTNIV